jgi:hypothetical protein
MSTLPTDSEPTTEEIVVEEAIRQRKSDAMNKLRSERDTLLNTTDKYAFMDYPINSETREKWNYYRQYLRDLPGMSSPDLDEDGNLVGVEWDAEKAAQAAQVIQAAELARIPVPPLER